MQNLVVNIGDVSDEGDFVSALGQPSAENVEINATSNMADMR